MGGTISAIADEAETGVRHTVTSFEQLQRLRRVRLSQPAYLGYLLRGTRSHRAAERCIARLLTSEWRWIDGTLRKGPTRLG